LATTGSQLLALLLGVHPVYAGDNASTAPPVGTTTPETLEEVTVTAAFRTETVQHTAVSLTAISGESMAARGDNNVADVANHAPNVTLTAAPAAFGNSVTASIRGVGQFDPSFALEPGVGIYVDEVYQGTLFGSLLDLLDLQRVEVLRGPQGILAGKNSIGGAIKLFSKPPSDQDDYAQVDYGSYNRLNLKASASFALVPDILTVRLSGISKHADGWFKNYDYACTHPGSGLTTSRTGSSCELGTEGGQSVDGGRALLRFTPTDWVMDDLSVTYLNDRSETAPTKLIYAANPAVTSNGVPFDSRFLTGAHSDSSYATYCATPSDGNSFCLPRENTLQAWMLSNNLELRLPANIGLKLITGAQGSRGVGDYDADGSPLNVELTKGEYATHQFTQELRLNGNLFGTAVEWTAGAFYFHSRDTAGARDDLEFGGLDFLMTDIATTQSTSGFANVRWNASDKLGISVGGRYTSDRKDYVYNRYNADGSAIPCGNPTCTVNSNWQLYGLSGLEGSYKGSHTDYRVAVDYQWTEALMTYADVATGYKGGGVNPRPFFPSQVVPFSPETLTSYEVGVKSDWLEHRLRTNLAGFFSRYEGIQQNISVCDQDSPFPGAPCLMPVNAGNANIKGVELEAQARITSALAVDASLSILSFDYTTVNPDTGITKGMITTYTPKQKYSAGLEYALPIGAAGVLTPRVDWIYQSSIYTNTAVNTQYNRVSPYGLTNVHLLWVDARGKWEGALALNNAFNKFYYLSKIDESEPAQGGFVNGRPGAPRTWLISVKRKF